jgi:hypothetical protein
MTQQIVLAKSGYRAIDPYDGQRETPALDLRDLGDLASLSIAAGALREAIAKISALGPLANEDQRLPTLPADCLDDLANYADGLAKVTTS